MRHERSHTILGHIQESGGVFQDEATELLLRIAEAEGKQPRKGRCQAAVLGTAWDPGSDTRTNQAGVGRVLIGKHIFATRDYLDAIPLTGTRAADM